MKKKRCKKCSSWFVPEEETLACCDDCAREILNELGVKHILLRSTIRLRTV